MLILPPAIPLYVPPTHVFGEARGSTATATSYNFATVGIGAASPGRFVCVGVAVSATTGSPITGVTIGGIAATQLSSNNNIGTAFGSSWWGAFVPTGTTATIVVTCGTQDRCWICTYAVYNSNLQTVRDLIQAGSAAGTVGTGTVDVRQGDIVLAFSAETNTGGGTNATWVGATEDGAVDAGAARWLECASLRATANEIGRTISATWNASTQFVLNAIVLR